MEARRLQGWWLTACVIALLLAYWAGGFSLVATFIFVVIYLTGATLIGRDEDTVGTEDAEDPGDTEAEDKAEDKAGTAAEAERSS